MIPVGVGDGVDTLLAVVVALVVVCFEDVGDLVEVVVVIKLVILVDVIYEVVLILGIVVELDVVDEVVLTLVVVVVELDTLTHDPICSSVRKAARTPCHGPGGFVG